MPEEINPSSVNEAVLTGDQGKPRTGKKGMLLMVIVLVLALVAALIFYVRNKSAEEIIPVPTGDQGVPAAGNQGASVGSGIVGDGALLLETIEKIGKLVELPEGENPALLTVSDPEKLRDQPFFAEAKIGDRLLLYQRAQQAFLYDPVADKVLGVAAIGIQPTSGMQDVVEDTTVPTE